MKNFLTLVVSNKLLMGMVVSFLFTVIWSLTIYFSTENFCAVEAQASYFYRCSPYYYCMERVAKFFFKIWITLTALGSLTFLGASGFYIRNHIRSKQETQQDLEFNTNTIELSTVNSGVHDIIDPTQNKLAEEDLDKEIAFFEKRKKLAQLKNEVINLEAVGVRASTSSSLGQVISVNRGY